MKSIEQMNNGELHKAILQESAMYFDWSGWNAYSKSNRDAADQLKNDVYHMMPNEKKAQLKAIRNKAEHIAFAENRHDAYLEENDNKDQNSDAYFRRKG